MTSNILIIFGWNEPARDKKALEILKSGKNFEHIILTWTKKEDNISKHFLKKHITSWKLWIDRKSWDTVSNVWYCNKILQAHFSKEKLGKLKLYCVSNWQHFKRIKTIFNIKIFTKKIFPDYQLENIKSFEKISEREKKLSSLYETSFVFILLGFCWSFLIRR